MHGREAVQELLKLLMLTVAFAAPAAPLEPVDVAQFWIEPSRTAQLEWKAPSRSEEPLLCVVHDYGDRQIATVELKPADQGRVRATVALPQGYYELAMPNGERFGLVCLAPAGERDSFFCIDSAMSWLVRDEPLRRGLVDALGRAGVVMARERLNWAQVQPAADQWEWDGPLAYETLRRSYASKQIAVLEMFHNAPRWTGLVGKYPADLPASVRAWRQIARRWQATWGAFEVWNEPDIFFGDNLPADQYVALVRTLRYAFDQGGVDVPLVTGVLAHYHQQFLDNAARNGLLQMSDAVSFHTYGRAMSMEELVGRYRRWLSDNHCGSMPLWITECGRPWRCGPSRPPADQDAESALDVVMKAVEARACGVARYFAFVYPFYEERENNFGMMGREGTPLRSMAAYTQCIRTLAGKNYLGDLRVEDSAVLRARVFGDQRETVAVIYTGKPQPDAKVHCACPVTRAEGIDGRLLSFQSDGTLPVPDGMVYAWLQRDAVGRNLHSNTAAMRLGQTARENSPPKPEPVSPLVMRHQFDAEVFEAVTAGYRFKQAVPDDWELAVRVYNLGGEPEQARVRAQMTPPAAVGPAEAQSVEVPAEGFAEVRWRVAASEAMAASGRARVTVTAESRTGQPPAVLVIDLMKAEATAAAR